MPNDVVPATPAAPVPASVGQATAVEQSRAMAEVQTAAFLARRFPRNVDAARTAIEQSCKMYRFADAAFYSMPRGNKRVNGPTIQFAQELARCWGHIQYGLGELRRDDVAGESELQAWAWDVETNARASTTFIVPHRRDVDGSTRALRSLQEIYENNANMGGRRLREMILKVIPPWIVEEAKDECRATLEKGEGKTVEERAKDAVDVLGRFGVSQDQIEQKLGRPQERWTVYDLAQLSINYRSIQRGEADPDDLFPTRRVTAAEITNRAPAAEDADRASSSNSKSSKSRKGDG